MILRRSFDRDLFFVCLLAVPLCGIWKATSKAPIHFGIIPVLFALPGPIIINRLSNYAELWPIDVETHLFQSEMIKIPRIDEGIPKAIPKSSITKIITVHFESHPYLCI